MKKYEYKFVEVPARLGFRDKAGDTFEDCKKIIVSESENGWRLKQVVSIFNEEGAYLTTGYLGYQIIFEREI